MACGKNAVFQSALKSARKNTALFLSNELSYNHLMYSRKIESPPEVLVRNGKPVFGTFGGATAKIDIRGLRAPFGGVPLPAFISNFRIKSFLSFVFNIGQYIGTVEFFDQKIFGYAEVVFWDKETGRKLAYHSLMGPRRRFIPHNLNQGVCASFGKKRYIRIGWDRTRDRVSMIFNLSGDSVRPSARAAFVAHYSDSGMTETVSNVPVLSKRRCSALYLSTPQIHGSLSIDKTKHFNEATMQDTDGQSLFSISRAFYDLYTETEVVKATGITDGKTVSFVISAPEVDESSPESVNKNLLIVDGKRTPLPPVKITHPFGVQTKWVIQDTENMIDLTFEPVSDNFRDIAFLVMRTQTHLIYGKFGGTLKTADNQSIDLNDFVGIAKKQLLRL